MPLFDLEHRIRAAYVEEQLPVPVDGLRRVHARRAAGERPRLVSGTSRPRARLWWWLAAAVAAAAAGVALLRRDTAPPLARVELPDLLPAPLVAQKSSPGAPRIGFADGSRLSPGLWILERRGAGQINAAGQFRRDSVSIRATDYEGRPAWLFVSASDYNSGGPAKWVESAWMTRDSLRPLARVFRLRTGSRVETTFTGDSVVRVWEKPDGSVERIAVPTPVNPPWTDGITLIGDQVEALLRLVPLAHGWRGSYPAMAIANTGKLITLWGDLHVSGEEWITTPAGRWDCWKVSGGAPTRDDNNGYTFWVDKRTGVTVKTGGSGGGWVERILVSEHP
jgi:hypothetical protein